MEEVLIAMCVWDTVENKRSKFTKLTLESLVDTVDLRKHRLIVIDNNSCIETREYLMSFDAWINKSKDINAKVIFNKENVGTAKAINQAWRHKKSGQHVIKMDNDVIINQRKWVDELLSAIKLDPSIGIIGLKRKDLLESPNEKWDSPYRSSLRMLAHTAGEPWVIVEDVNHVMGTCQMYNTALIHQMGGLYQMDGLYGFDDSLASIRSKIAGFKNCFLPHINMDHIDPGGTAYQQWKENYAGEMIQKYSALANELLQTKNIYYPL